MILFDPRMTISRGTQLEIGPWPCSECGEMSQFAIVRYTQNFIFCRNENCKAERLVDKHNSRIIEPDGTTWAFDSAGNKWRVRGQ